MYFYFEVGISKTSYLKSPNLNDKVPYNVFDFGNNIMILIDAGCIMA